MLASSENKGLIICLRAVELNGFLTYPEHSCSILISRYRTPPPIVWILLPPAPGSRS